MKKLVSLCLVLVMILALTVPAFAADEKDVKLDPMSITVNNALPGYSYTVYEVLKVATYDATLNAYRYVTIPELPWNVLKDLSATVDGATHTVSEYLTTEEPVAGAEDVAKQYVIWKTGVGTEAGAQQLAQILRANRNSLKKIETKEAPKGAERTTVQWTGLEAGYYLVDSTAGVLCGMDTAQKVGDSYDVVINEKNKIPTPDKEVKEDSTGTWGKKNTADIGDVIDFRVVISAQPGAENYILHDQMSVGLTWKGEVVVEEFAAGEGKTGTALKTLNAGTDYTLVSNPDDGCTFDVVFSETYLDTRFGQTTSLAGDIVVSYKARVNDKALIDSPNPNDSDLTYGEGHRTTKTTTNTWTFDFNIYKFGTNSNTGATNVALADAHFTLYRDAACTKAVKFEELANKHYKSVSDAADDVAVTDLVTDGTGKILITGLDADTYYLKETQAPAGYNLLDRVITVVIDDEGHVTFDGAVSQTNVGTEDEPKMIDEIKIENKTGTELPSTGGIGTTIFYVIGGLLMAAAVVLLVTKKKMSSVND